MILIKQNAQQAQLVQKINQEAGVNDDQIKSLMMPFQTGSGQIQFGNGCGGVSMANNNLSYFNNKVLKPVRGGGKASHGTANKAGPDLDSAASGGIDFENFIIQRPSLAKNFDKQKRSHSKAPSKKDQKRQSI